FPRVVRKRRRIVGHGAERRWNRRIGGLASAIRHQASVRLHREKAAADGLERHVSIAELMDGLRFPRSDGIAVHVDHAGVVAAVFYGEVLSVRAAERDFHDMAPARYGCNPR